MNWVDGMIAADVLAKGLKRHGIDLIFSQCFPVLTQHVLPDYGVRQIGFRTENSGGTMADGYARVARHIAVVAAQSGPGATLLVPPLAEALHASVPLLAIVEEYPRAQADRNAFQEMDHLKLFEGCSKWTRRVDDPNRIEDYLDMAIVTATSGRPGPVVLIMPSDMLGREVKSAARTQALGHVPLDRMRPAANRIATVAEMIAAAERPIILAGGGVHMSDASGELVALAERLAIPVATTNMGKGAISELNPLALGVFGNCMQEGAPSTDLRSLAAEADLVILVGTRTNANGTDSWSLFSADAAYIHIDVDGVEMGRNYEAYRLAGDAQATLAAVNTELELRNAAAPEGRRETIAERTDAARAASQRWLDDLGTGEARAIRPEHMLRVLDAKLGPQDIVTADASYASNWVSTYLTARADGVRFLEPRGLAGLGWGFPLALGAKLARQEANVFAIVGDGGFAHCWSELETAKRLNISVVIIVLNNQILGYQRHGEEWNFNTHSDAADLGPVDHAAIARACGCYGEQVSDPNEIGPAIDRALASKSPAVIDLITDDQAHPPLTLFAGKDRAVQL